MLPVVREAEKRLVDNIDHEYLPVLGYEPFCNAAVELVLGKNSPTVKDGKVCDLRIWNCSIQISNTDLQIPANYMVLKRKLSAVLGKIAKNISVGNK